MSRFFKPFFFLSVSIVGITGNLMYNAYQYSKQPSRFELAAKQLGFNTSQQEALLKIFYLAGYLEPKNLWHDLSSFDKTGHSQEIYASIIHSLNIADTNHTGINKFNFKLLRKNLFKDTDKINIQDAEAWILYVAQNAFGRKIGQERNELTNTNWMSKYQDEYLQSAKELGLIDEILPKHQQYDEGWIAGASRIGILARIIHYNELLKKVEIKGITAILAGERPLWAELDGIEPKEFEKLLAEYKGKSDISRLDTVLLTGNTTSRTDEGKEYIGALAKANNIELNPNEPFIKYKNAEECPKGFFPGRTYPNYLNPNQPKLTESLMANDLLKFLNNKAIIIDTKSENNQRPNTSTTAHDAVINLVKKIKNGDFGEQKDFIILFETNNPYIERQTIATQRAVDKVLKDSELDKQGYKITIEGVGFANKQDVSTIHSELAALLAEKYKDVANDKYTTEELLYQTRPHSEASDNTLPLIGDVGLTIFDKIQIIFDNYTG